MDDKFKQFFKNFGEIEPSLGLKEKILAKIKQEEIRQLRGKLLLSYAGLGFSAILFFAAGFAFGNAFVGSEFWNMASLLFSDSFLVLTHWKEFSFSLMETFPTTSAIGIMLPLFTLLLSLNLYLNIHNNILKISNSKKPKFI